MERSPAIIEENSSSTNGRKQGGFSFKYIAPDRPQFTFYFLCLLLYTVLLPQIDDLDLVLRSCMKIPKFDLSLPPVIFFTVISLLVVIQQIILLNEIYESPPASREAGHRFVQIIFGLLSWLSLRLLPPLLLLYQLILFIRNKEFTFILLTVVLLSVSTLTALIVWPTYSTGDTTSRLSIKKAWGGRRPIIGGAYLSVVIFLLFAPEGCIEERFEIDSGIYSLLHRNLDLRKVKTLADIAAPQEGKVETVRTLDLSDRDLSKAVFSGVSIYKVIFTGSDLTGAQFKGSELHDVSFDNAVLDGASFKDATMVNVDYRTQNAAGADFSKAKITNGKFAGAKIVSSNFKGAELNQCDFKNAHLINIEFNKRTVFDNVSFDSATLERVIFSEVRAYNLDMQSATLTDAHFRLAELPNAHFNGAHLKSCDFSNAKMKGAVLQGAIFYATNFKNAELIGADLSMTQLGCSDFSRAQMDGAFLRRSNIEGATFESTELFGSDFHYANVCGISLLNAKVNLTDLREISRVYLKRERIEILRSEITSSKLESGRKKYFLDRLEMISDRCEEHWGALTYQGAVYLDRKLSTKWGATDSEIYYKRLPPLLTKLVCDNLATANPIIENRIGDNTQFHDSILTPLLAIHLNNSVCLPNLKQIPVLLERVHAYLPPSSR